MTDKYPYQVEFWVAKRETFTVSARAWFYRNLDGAPEWKWNVYAYIFDNNKLFNEPERIKDCAPFHWGCTLDELKTTEPSTGIKYDWQKVKKTYCFGSDYSHLHDPESHPSPLEGVPWYVERDALELVEWLEEAIPTQQEEATC